MRARTHLVLADDDLIHNITPVLDATFRPEQVVLLTAPDYHKSADRLERILRDYGLGVSRWLLDDPWDVEHVRHRVLEFLADHDHEDIALNVSGGTRPMSLAAFEIFGFADKPVFYVHPDTDHVVWLSPRDRTSFDLADRIRLPAFFKARDLRLIDGARQGIHEELRALTATMVRKVSQYVPALAILNWYASEAANRDGLVSSSVHRSHFQIPEVLELLELFSGQNLLKVDTSQRLVFADNDARFYVNGGWLEEHVFGEISRLRKKLPLIQDLARNVEIEWDELQSPVKNELDVVFLADNRLYLIECKTKNFDKKPSPQADVANTLYKLGTLRETLGGKSGRAMLVSYTNLKKAHRQRAWELGIEVCEGLEIAGLENRVQRWIGE